MDILRFDLSSLPARRKNLSLALGHFDGMHRGHQALFLKTVIDAEGDAGALLFTHPYGQKEALSSIDDKIRYAASLRLDVLYVLDNDESLFSLSPEAFMEQVLTPLGTTRVVVGEDYRFGKGGKGDASSLRSHFQTDVVPLLCEDGEKISSSRIAELISKGDVYEASNLLGRPYEISGTVIEGKKLGRTIGFPTLNVRPSFPYVLPKKGVYFALAYISGMARHAIVNVGVDPTVCADLPLTIEAHILDYEGDDYGKKVYLAFLHYHRPETRFASLEELKAQIAEDQEEAIAYFGR